MVSEGVILGMVRDEFWKQYAQVPIQVEDAAKVISALNEALREVANAAVEPEKEKRAAA
jgi:hypothetical protein